jgi:cytochrome c peroxidase
MVRVRPSALARCALLMLACGNPDASAAEEAPHASPLPSAAEGVRESATFEWSLPRGFPTPSVPADNPISAEKVRLGRLLFYDRRLSVTGKYACASCHEQLRAFTDGRARAVGAMGDLHPRSTMSLGNVAYNAAFTWIDAGFASLESQALQPLLNQAPVEMGLKGREVAVLAELAADATYRDLFARSFPDDPAPISVINVTRALASFERTLISGRSAFDRYVFDDDRAALDVSARRGMAFFYGERFGCARCHSGIAFSGPIVHAGQPTAEPAFVDTGEGRFRVPTLRNAAVTAPYMHDGRFVSLADVIDDYAAGRPHAPRAASAHVPPRDPRLQGFAISAAEKADLLAFLESLTDRDFLTDPRFGPP